MSTGECIDRRHRYAPCPPSLPPAAHLAQSVHSCTCPSPGATAPVTPPDTSITVASRCVTLFQCCTLLSCTRYRSWAAGDRRENRGKAREGEAGAAEGGEQLPAQAAAEGGDLHHRHWTPPTSEPHKPREMVGGTTRVQP
jgi:hypothetical protein